MNTKTLLTLSIALAGFAASTASMAGQIVSESPDQRPDAKATFVSQLTRMQVRDAAVQAQRAGLVPYGENSYFPTPAAASSKTRAQVRAELLEARRLGLTFAGENLPVATAAQLSSIEMAGLRALDRSPAAE